MKRIVLLCVSGFLVACSGRGDVDLSKATPLTAEPVANGPAAGQDPNPGTPHSLFNLNPGTWTSFKVAGGVVDPVGTTLTEDFDGDGIINGKELTSNIWVADYPEIEAQIAPPVSMKVEILKTTDQSTSTIDTDLTSDNFESRKSEGSENFHQNEVTVKTINNGSTTNSRSQTDTNSTTKDVKASVSGGFAIGPVSIGGSVSGGISNTSSISITDSSSTTTQLYEDRPFKNNIDRDAKTVKADEAAKKARDYRTEKRTKKDEHYVTKPDGGIVKAALYIKNHSVNMPVRLSNILCSLVFETTSGVLIPVQSFRLRNDDFSLFEVEVYGNSEFGPYVVTLPNLNTVEVENALAQGHTPKIFIVDYKMTHVQDSNYKQALSSNFTGDNLKIVEENAKGRTALLKIMYSGYREMFRIVAFDAKLTSTGTDICQASHIDTTGANTLSPGLPMHKLLERLRCSGVNIQFGHYIYDFTGRPEAGIYPRFYTYAVKSINNRAVTAPCTSYTAGMGYNPAAGDYVPVSNVCVIKVADLSEEQLDSFGMWGISSAGKYYAPGDYALDGSGAIRTFGTESLSGCEQGVPPCGIPVLKSLAATVWAGDNYDLVQMRMSDIMARLKSFGTNPLETGNAIALNTKWDLGTVGENPYDPESRSIYLGQAGLGEQVELVFNLKDTTFLNPDFGPDVDASSNLAFNQFTYDRKKTTKRFTIDEAVDFELSMGLGGSPGDWQNIMRPAAGANNITRGDIAVDYLKQQFTVMVKLPASHPLATATGVVNLYLRPALSNAYRNSIWPQDYTKVKKYDATLNSGVSSGNIVPIKTGIGTISDIAAGIDVLKVVTDGVVYSYSIEIAGGIVATPFGYNITVTPALATVHKAGDRVYVEATVAGPLMTMHLDRFDDTNNVFTAYSGQYPQAKLVANASAPLDCALSFEPMRCNGYNGSTNVDYDHVINNWLGNASFGNKWADGKSWIDQTLLVKPFGPILSGIVATPTPQIGSWGVEFSRPLLSSATGSDALISTSMGIYSNDPQVVISGYRALIIWKSFDSTNSVRGRVINLTTSLPEGSDFTISTVDTAAKGTLRASVSGDRAIIVWSSIESVSTYDIWGCVVDLISGTRVSNDFRISTSNAGNQAVPTVAASGNRAIAVWQSMDNGANFDVRGRIIDLVSAAGVGNDFLFSTTNVNHQIIPKIAISGNRALAVWNSADFASVTYELRGRFFDLATATAFGSDFLISTPNASSSAPPFIAATGNTALVSWSHQASGIMTIRGAIIDMSFGVISGSEMQISTTLGDHSWPEDMVIAGNRALVVWFYGTSGASDIRGRVLDLDSASGIGDDFSVSTSNAYQQEWPRITIVGRRALAIWQSHDSGENFDIRGRLVDLDTGLGIGADFLVSTSNTSQQEFPQVTSAGNRIVATWRTYDTGIHTQVRARQFNLTPEYGLNNFFTAPLIERNYTVTSRIKF